MPDCAAGDDDGTSDWKSPLVNWRLQVARLSGELTALRRAEARVQNEIQSRDAEIANLHRLLEQARGEAAALRMEREEQEVLDLAIRDLGTSGGPEDLATMSEEVKLMRQLQRDKQKDRILLQQQVARAQQRAEEAERDLEAARKETAAARAQLEALRTKRGGGPADPPGAASAPASPRKAGASRVRWRCCCPRDRSPGS